MLVVVGAFTSVHEAHLAWSVLQAAGIEARVADEHLVSMYWLYSNAIGGVKVLVPEAQAEEARHVLASCIEDVEAPLPSEPDHAVDAADRDSCPRCGSPDVTSRPAGLRFAVLSWLTIGLPLLTRTAPLLPAVWRAVERVPERPRTVVGAHQER
jgi:hypothetical protein